MVRHGVVTAISILTPDGRKPGALVGGHDGDPGQHAPQGLHLGQGKHHRREQLRARTGLPACLMNRNAAAPYSICTARLPPLLG